MQCGPSRPSAPDGQGVSRPPKSRGLSHRSSRVGSRVYGIFSVRRPKKWRALGSTRRLGTRDACQVGPQETRGIRMARRIHSSGRASRAARRRVSRSPAPTMCVVMTPRWKASAAPSMPARTSPAFVASASAATTFAIRPSYCEGPMGPNPPRGENRGARQPRGEPGRRNGAPPGAGWRMGGWMGGWTGAGWRDGRESNPQLLA